MAKKLTHITQYDGNSLDQLDFSLGIVGFDCPNPKHFYPFIITFPLKEGALIKWENNDIEGRGLTLIHRPKKSGKDETWNLKSKPNSVVELYPPTFLGKEIIKPEMQFRYLVDSPLDYYVKNAYVGKDEIIKALEARPDKMGIHAHILKF